MSIELIKQVEKMAEVIRLKGQKVISVYPLKKREDAHSNQSRRVLLEVLINGKACNPYRFTWTQLKGVREVLQKQAEAAGYQFIEINNGEIT